MSGLWEEILKLINNIFGLFAYSKKQIQKVVNIYDAIHRLLEETSIERITIVKAHNGGGFIKPDTPLYVSVVYEDYKQPLGSVKPDYQKVEADEELIRLVRDIMTRKSLRMNTVELKPSLIKDRYEADDIKHVEFSFLRHTRKGIYYCSFVTTQDGKIFGTPEERTAISIALNELKKNIV